MSKLSEIKDSNGTALQTFVSWMQEKCAECGCRSIHIVVMPGTFTTPNPIAIETNIAAALLPDALEAIARDLRVEQEMKKVEEPS